MTTTPELFATTIEEKIELCRLLQAVLLGAQPPIISSAVPFSGVYQKLEDGWPPIQEERIAWLAALIAYNGPPTYHQGQRFIYKNGEEYILASVDPSHRALIGLNSGNRFCEAVTVNDPRAVTQAELHEMMGGCNRANEFTLIESKDES